MNMMNQAGRLHSLRDQRLSGDRRDFNLVYAAAFTVFLIVFCLARLVPVSRKAGEEKRRRSIFEQAREQANILASCALMR